MTNILSTTLCEFEGLWLWGNMQSITAGLFQFHVLVWVQAYKATCIAQVEILTSQILGIRPGALCNRWVGKYSYINYYSTQTWLMFTWLVGKNIPYCHSLPIVRWRTGWCDWAAFEFEQRYVVSSNELLYGSPSIKHVGSDHPRELQSASCRVRLHHYYSCGFGFCMGVDALGQYH